MTEMRKYIDTMITATKIGKKWASGLNDYIVRIAETIRDISVESAALSG